MSFSRPRSFLQLVLLGFALVALPLIIAIINAILAVDRLADRSEQAVLEAAEARLDREPERMRARRETVEHPFGTLKSWMGSTHFQMKTLKHVSTEMSLYVLAYNIKRVLAILGVKPLLQAVQA